MANRPSLDDYVDVAERIVTFKEKHPEGSLQTIDWTVIDVGGKHFVVYQAAAYRTPDDERPGHGIAWEPFPGTTPYTKNSELMNAETAAWGRAIVAVGLASNRTLASRQEVRARVEEQEAGESKPASRQPSRGRGNTRPKPAEAASAPQDASSEGSPDGDKPACDETLSELRKVYKDAAPTDDDYRALLAEVGATVHTGNDWLKNSTLGLTEDQATWAVIKLGQRAREKAATG